MVLIIYIIKGLKGIRYDIFFSSSKNKKNNLSNPPPKNKKILKIKLILTIEIKNIIIIVK